MSVVTVNLFYINKDHLRHTRYYKRIYRKMGFWQKQKCLWIYWHIKYQYICTWQIWKLTTYPHAVANKFLGDRLVHSDILVLAQLTLRSLPSFYTLSFMLNSLRFMSWYHTDGRKQSKSRIQGVAQPVKPSVENVWFVILGKSTKTDMTWHDSTDGHT